MNIREKLSKIQFEFKAKKSRYNAFGKYNFRSAEDILESLKPFNDKYDVHFTVEENLTTSDFPIIHSAAKIVDNKSGDKITATAIVGVDLNAKGQQMPQRFGSASSYGKKYALGNLFLIDDTQDSDATNDHGQASVNAKQWMNKGSGPYHNALDYIKSGGKVSSIKKKYSMNKDVEAELNELVAKHHG